METRLDTNGSKLSREMSYQYNGLISKIIEMKDKEKHETVAVWDKASRRTELYTDNNATKEFDQYDANSRLSSALIHDTKQHRRQELTFGNFTDEDFPTRQVATYHSTSNGDWLQTDTFDSTMVGFNEWQLSKTAATRQVNYTGEFTHAVVDLTHDANGNFQTLCGNLDSGEHFVWFLSNSNKRIVLREGDNGRLNYFYYYQDKLLGWVEFQDNQLQSIHFDPLFCATGVNMPPVSPQYVAQAGDTFVSIANQLYFNADYATTLAIANGFLPNEEIPAGMTLRAPNRDLQHTNRMDQFAPYQPSAILGNTMPVLPMPPVPPPPRHHHSFFDIVAEIVEFAVGAFVMALGQEYLVPLLVKECGALVGGAVGWGLTGAASDAARQGVAMATGEQSKFSWEELGQSAELSAITGGLKEELEVTVFPHAPNTTLGGDTPIPRSVFSSYGMTILENETIAVAKNLVLMATGQEKRFAWKDLINTAGQSILNVTVDNALGVTNNEPNLLAALLNTELGAVISSAVYKNTIDPWQAAGEAFGMTAGQTLIASQRVYVHKKEIAQQKKRDQEEFKKEIASSMEIAFTEALQEMDMDPTFLAGKYFTGSVSNHKKPSIGFWGQPLDGIKHRPSKSDQDRNRQHREVIDQTSQQAHQHHDTDLSYAQYVQQNSVEGMWQQRMSQSSSTHNKSVLSSTLDVLENALLGLPLGGPQASEPRGAAQKVAMGVVLGVGDFVNDMSNLGLYALYVAGHPDVLFSDIGKAFNSYWGNAVAVMKDPKTALKNDFDDYQSFANLDLQSQTRLETNLALGFFGRVGEIGKVAEAGLLGEKSTRLIAHIERVSSNIVNEPLMI